MTFELSRYVNFFSCWNFLKVVNKSKIHFLMVSPLNNFFSFFNYVRHRMTINKWEIKDVTSSVVVLLLRWNFSLGSYAINFVVVARLSSPTHFHCYFYIVAIYSRVVYMTRNSSLIYQSPSTINIHESAAIRLKFSRSHYTVFFIT